MQNHASVVLDYIWLLEFSEEDDVDPDSAVKLLEDLTYQHGYTPRKLLTSHQKALLEAIAAGRIDGFDIEDVTDEQ